MSLFSDLGFGNALVQFMSKGGPVLWWLASLILLFWLIAIERVLYLLVTFPKRQNEWLKNWGTRGDHHSWYAQKQRDAWVNQAHIELFQNINLLKLIISLFPMLGLLGTVTGMISVFDVLAVEGTSQPRLMASGISMATLPTMAGMVAALAGVFCYSQLFAALEKREVHLEKLMRSRT
ncbi:MotA/TolQ/ExbB proton channel family protein [Vibrio sp. F74]|uniref:MotA/TolQ/ExbB proton channel family protein n=1 Tax=Vibrio sp. F74 TaxID=700020 RepID=UPI0035F55B2D